MQEYIQVEKLTDDQRARLSFELSKFYADSDCQDSKYDNIMELITVIMEKFPDYKKEDADQSLAHSWYMYTQDLSGMSEEQITLYQDGRSALDSYAVEICQNMQATTLNEDI